MRGPARLLAAFLVLLGSQVLHHLRYLVAPDREHADTLADHGAIWHLLATGPALGVLATLVVAGLVVRVAALPAPSVRARRAWPLVTGALLATYGVQEGLEGSLGNGHEAGLHALVGGYGWVVVPLAIVLGGAVALAIRVTLDATVAQRIELAARIIVAGPVTLLLGRSDHRPPRPVLSEHGAGRAPPVAA
jgi:hypothetical protein